MMTTTVDKIDKLFYRFIKEAVMKWVQENVSVQFQEMLDKRMKYGWNEDQVIYQEIVSDGYHEIEIAEDGMSAVYKQRRSYMFFDIVLKENLNIEVKFPERLVPAVPVSYNKDAHFTTVDEATRIRKRIIDIMSESI